MNRDGVQLEPRISMNRHPDRLSVILVSSLRDFNRHYVSLLLFFSENKTGSCDSISTQAHVLLQLLIRVMHAGAVCCVGSGHDENSLRLLSGASELVLVVALDWKMRIEQKRKVREILSAVFADAPAQIS
jgi:hypothetical protein